METVFTFLGQRVRLWPLLAALMMLALTVSIGYTVRQSDFGPLIGQYLVLFALYWVLFQGVQSKNELPFLLLAAVVLRFSLLFSWPLLSDDVYRFIWDGRLWNAGINPFSELPAYYLQPGREVPGLTRELFAQLNSPAYFTVYPPVAQAFFALAVWLSPHEIGGTIWVLKALLFLFELGNLWLIPQVLRLLKLPARNVLIYALNPLVILETIGNLHFEGVMVFFLLLALFALLKGRWLIAAPLWALSVATKLVPLLFLPFLIRRLAFWRLAGFGLVFLASAILLFGPMLPGGLYRNMGQSLDLYFQNFEFNASLYYLLREGGYWWKGYNIIGTLGPALAGVTFVSVMLMALLFRDRSWKSLPTHMLFAVSVFLLLATTVHPWYTILPLSLGLFTRFRYPVLWTALIYLTYINYSYVPYRENLWVVAFEYTALFLFAFYELRTLRPANPAEES